MENKETAFKSVYSQDKSKLTSLSDAILRTEDGYVFNIHRFVLARKSRYFYALFCGLDTERRDIVIPGVKGRILDIVLGFIYTGTTNFSEDTLIDLLYVSDYLTYNDLLLKVQEYAIANLSTKNCVQLLAASFKVGQRSIYDESFRFTQTHFEYVVKEEDSQISEISFDIMKQLLEDRNTCVKSENTVWNSIVKWVEFDDVPRQPYVPNLLQCLKVDDLDESLASTIMEHKIVVKNRFCDNLNGLKSLGSYNSDLQLLTEYLEDQHSSTLQLNKRRVPTKMHFFMKCFIVENAEFLNVHLTYDDKIDLWRKVLETEMYGHKFLTIGNRLYLFNGRSHAMKCFDFIQNAWITVEKPERARYDFCILKHEGLIFILGGRVRSENRPSTIVESFDPELNAWSDITSMLPIERFEAVSLGSKIYIVGHVPQSTVDAPSMMMQVYDPQVNEWTLISPPEKFYDKFALVSYGDKIYIIGGKNDVTDDSKAVEVFDTVVNIWVDFESVPYEFKSPHAFALNDWLIVQDRNHSRFDHSFDKGQTICWNKELQRWEQFEEPSPLNKLSHYQLCTIEDAQSLELIANANKENISHFVKSPFK